MGMVMRWRETMRESYRTDMSRLMGGPDGRVKKMKKL